MLMWKELVVPLQLDIFNITSEQADDYIVGHISRSTCTAHH